MTLTFDPYMVAGGILSEFLLCYDPFLYRCYTLQILVKFGPLVFEVLKDDGGCRSIAICHQIDSGVVRVLVSMSPQYLLLFMQNDQIRWSYG